MYVCMCTKPKYVCMYVRTYVGYVGLCVSSLSMLSMYVCMYVCSKRCAVRLYQKITATDNITADTGYLLRCTTLYPVSLGCKG